MDSADSAMLKDLANGPGYPFRDWPNNEVPDVTAGVYAVWRDNGELVYVGMSGRSSESLRRAGRRGLWTRLDSHRGGRLSGDQFCVYIANWYVVPELRPEQLPRFATGELRLDALTKMAIRRTTDLTGVEHHATTSDGSRPPAFVV